MHELIIDKLANHQKADLLVVFNTELGDNLPKVQCLVERDTCNNTTKAFYGNPDLPITSHNEIFTYQLQPRVMINAKRKDFKSIGNNNHKVIGYGWFKHFYRHWIVYNELKKLKHPFTKMFSPDGACKKRYWHMLISGNDLKLFQVIKATILFHWLAEDFKPELEEVIAQFFEDYPSMRRNETKVRKSIDVNTERKNIEEMIVNGGWLFNINDLK